MDEIDFYVQEILNWKIFIYPTDTVLGIGGDATNPEVVQKIFEIKQREPKPFLVMAPSFDWIYSTCTLSVQNKKSLEEKLPGPFSFVLKMKQDINKKNTICPEVTNWGQTLGVRIPDCWFAELVARAGIPFISTSVNFAWEAPALKISDIPKDIKQSVDYVINSTSWLSNVSSTVIDITGTTEKILRA